MHQGHNIPWSTISSNFRFVENDTRFTPPRTGLISNESPNSPKELKHFIKKFVGAIQSFSETERKKYPAAYKPQMAGNIFPDELLLKYPEYLNERNQKIEHWIEQGVGGYNTSHAGLAEVVKILIDENELATLLMLARHPSFRIADLHNLHWGHHFGFSRVKESAVHSYLFFNCSEATGILENGKYTKTDDYAYLTNEISESMDYPAQQIPHRRFLEVCGVVRPGRSVRYQSAASGTASTSTSTSTLGVHADYALLQEYLKHLFALMYRYDVLMRECGAEPGWEAEIAEQYPFRGCLEMEWDESRRVYVLA